eukprot:3129346-Rhodomonas_salina.1
MLTLTAALCKALRPPLPARLHLGSIPPHYARQLPTLAVRSDLDANPAHTVPGLTRRRMGGQLPAVDALPPAARVRCCASVSAHAAL